MPAALDHLVLVVPDLDEAVLDLAHRTGVQPVAGGRHPGLGTRNALVGLSWKGSRRRYLEILGPDPDQPKVKPKRTMLGAGKVWDKGPRLHGWAVRVHDEELDETLSRAGRAGIDVGEPVTAQRLTADGTTISWRLSVPSPLGLGGVQPFLIDWRGGAHPADQHLPTLELLSLRLRHPDPERATKVLRTLGVGMTVEEGNKPRLTAVLGTPEGQITLR